MSFAPPINDAAGMIQSYVPKPGDRQSRVDRGEFNRHGLVKSQMGPPLLFFPEHVKRLFDPRDVKPFIHPDIRAAKVAAVLKTNNESDRISAEDHSMSIETVTSSTNTGDDSVRTSVVESNQADCSNKEAETEGSAKNVPVSHEEIASSPTSVRFSSLTGISEVYVMARFEALQNGKHSVESSTSSSSSSSTSSSSSSSSTSSSSSSSYSSSSSSTSSSNVVTHMSSSPEVVSVLPTVNESSAQKRLKRLAENSAANKSRIEKEKALYDPKNNKEFTGNAYCTLYVGRLSYSTTEETLRKFFSPFGEIVSIKIVHKRTIKEGDDEEGAALTVVGSSRGYAFIEFASENGVRAAFQNSKGAIIDGRKIITDVERGRTVRGWLPARLGGGLSKARETRPKTPTAADDRVYPPIGAFGVLIPISLEGQTSPMAVIERHIKIKAAAKRAALDAIAKANGTWVPQPTQSAWPTGAGGGGGGGAAPPFGGRPGGRWARQQDQHRPNDGYQDRDREREYERDRSRDSYNVGGGYAHGGDYIQERGGRY
jgi:hypothetical protein